MRLVQQQIEIFDREMQLTFTQPNVKHSHAYNHVQNRICLRIDRNVNDKRKPNHVKLYQFHI